MIGSFVGHPDPSLLEETIDLGLTEHSVGALIVRDGDVLAQSPGAIAERPDATAHSEIEAIREACRRAGEPELPGAWFYSTHEPCPMCSGAACWAGIEGIVFAVGHDEMPPEWGEQTFETPATHVIDDANRNVELHSEVGRERALRIPEHD